MFIADLHLTPRQPLLARKFYHFLDRKAGRASRLYILGDLFDAWIGDDDSSRFSNAVRQSLRQASSRGLEIFFQPGNRDFLLGSDFCRQTGVQLLPDFQVIDLFGMPTLITHGDLLCTDDVVYQRFRVRSHTPEWRQQVLARPLWQRRLAVRWYRLRSFWHKRGQSETIMDVNQQEVINIMRHYQVIRLIHGHTHRSAAHRLTIDGQAAERIVLADWRGRSGHCLSISDQGVQREQF